MSESALSRPDAHASPGTYRLTAALWLGAGGAYLSRWLVGRFGLPSSPEVELTPLQGLLLEATWPLFLLYLALLGVALAAGWWLTRPKRASLWFLLPFATAAASELLARGAASENPRLVGTQLAMLLDHAPAVAIGLGVLLTSVAARWTGAALVGTGVLGALAELEWLSRIAGAPNPELLSPAGGLEMVLGVLTVVWPLALLALGLALLQRASVLAGVSRSLPGPTPEPSPPD